MRTFLGSLSLLAFLGLLPFAIADSQTKPASSAGEAVAAASLRPPKKPSSRSAEKQADRPKAPSKFRSKGEGDGKADAAQALVKLSPAQAKRLLAWLNESSVEALEAIPGVARSRAECLVQARPFAELDQVFQVAGIGASTYAKLLRHGQSLETSPKKTPAAKAQSARPKAGKPRQS